MLLWNPCSIVPLQNTHMCDNIVEKSSFLELFLATLSDTGTSALIRLVGETRTARCVLSGRNGETSTCWCLMLFDAGIVWCRKLLEVVNYSVNVQPHQCSRKRSLNVLAINIWCPDTAYFVSMHYCIKGVSVYCLWSLKCVFSCLCLCLLPLESLRCFPSTLFPLLSIVIHRGLTLWSLFPLSGTVRPAGSGQLPLGPGWPALWGPGPPDQRAELCWLEHRQVPQGPEGCGGDPYWAGGQRQVRGNRCTRQW